MKKLIYLDYASTTPQSNESVAAMQQYFKDDFYNPSALYLAAKNVSKNLENLRASVAGILQVRPTEVFFGAGSTEANNIIIQGIMNQYIECNMIASAIEHDSVLNIAKKYNSKLVGVNDAGIIDVLELAKIINDKTVLISCMSANNEIGTVQPVSDIARLINKIKKERLQKGNTTPLFLHVDASQSFNYLPLLPHALGIDFAVVGGSKIYGPKQTSVFFIKNGIKLEPLIIGGGQEKGVRSGTENVAGIAGLVAAIKQTDDMRIAESERLLQLRNMLVEGLKKLDPSCVINGSLKNRLPNNVHVTFNNIDNETLVMQLDEKGIMVATGSACNASSDAPSHVLSAIGLSGKQAQSSVRITTGRNTTKSDITVLLDSLGKFLIR